MRSSRSHQAGFTLVELMIAVAIMGILAPTFVRALKQWMVFSTRHSVRVELEGPMRRISLLLREDARSARSVRVLNDGASLELSGTPEGRIRYVLKEGGLERQPERGSPAFALARLETLKCTVQGQPGRPQLLTLKYRAKGMKNAEQVFVEMVGR